MKSKNSIYDGIDFPVFIERPDVVAFIGENYPYYRELWLKDYEKKGSVAKIWQCYHWNWLAFFSVVSWFAYRKMYLFAIAITGMLVCITFLDSFFAWGLSNNAFAGMNIILLLMSKGNYFNHIVMFFHKNKDKTEEEMKSLIEKHGSVRIPMAVVFFVLPIVLVIGAAVLGDALSGRPDVVGH